jgi:hypothetical protein
MKVLSILMAMVNTLLSGLILLSCVSFKYLHLDALVRISGRLATALLVILVGALTYRDGVRPLHPAVLLIGGMMLILLGTGSAVWGIHLSLVSGDLKKAVILYGGSLVVQGNGSIWGLAEPALPTAS